MDDDKALKGFIFGASGLAREVRALLHDLRKDEEVFLVESDEVCDREGIPLAGLRESQMRSSPGWFVIGIGRPLIRSDLWRRISEDMQTLRPETLIHPRADFDLSRNDIAPGSIVASGAVATTGVAVAENVYINLNVTLGHEAYVGPHSVINPQASISGGVTIGARVLLGTNCTVLEGLTIGDDAVVGAGAVVVKDVPAGAVVVGVPAKRIK